MKRPRTGKPVNMREYKDRESLLQAKKYYSELYPEKLYEVPSALIFSPNYLRITPMQLAEGLRKLDIPATRPDLYW